MSAANYSSGNDEAIKKSMLDHPHLFRNGLPALWLCHLGIRVLESSFVEPNRVVKSEKSVGNYLMFVAAAVTFKLASLALIGDCIDVE